MDLSDFDPYHPSNNSSPSASSPITTLPSRLFQTPPPSTTFNSSLTSRLHSNTPPPPPPLPSKPVKEDPLDAFDLLSFDDSTKFNSNNVSLNQPSILAHNLRQETTMRDLNRDPWSSFSEVLPVASSSSSVQSFLIPPPGSLLTQLPIANRDFNNNSNITTSTTTSSFPLNTPSPRPIDTTINNFTAAQSKPQFNSTNPSTSNSDSFQSFNDFTEGTQYSPNEANGGEEEDWWSGFQSGTVSPQEDVSNNNNNNNKYGSSTLNNQENLGGTEQQEVKRSQKSEQYRQRMMRGMKGKEREKPLPLPNEQQKEDSFDPGRDDWDFNAGGVDTLKPIRLLGVTADHHRALTEEVAEGIRPHLPPRLRVSRKWNLIYSVDQHGISIETMYERMNSELAYSDGGVVIVVKDGSGSIFGAYVNQGLQELNHYYGDGSCFLWKATPFAPEDFRVGSSIKTFKWTGKNDYLILTESTFLSVGGGNGKFGLWIDSVFDKGFSAKCPCFDNEPLTAKYEKGVLDGEEAKFDVVIFECWAVDK